MREGQAPQRLACACVSNRSPLDGGFCCSVNLSLANPIGIPPVRNSKIAIALPNEAATKGQLRHRNGKLEGKPKRTPKRARPCPAERRDYQKRDQGELGARHKRHPTISHRILFARAPPRNSDPPLRRMALNVH